MTISVIVPAYNESKTIIQVLDKLVKIKPIKQIIVVDDASTDNTKELVSKHPSKLISLISLAENTGKGAALRTGLKEANQQYVFIQDADLEYDPNELHKLIEVVEQHNAKVVYGSRFTGTRKNMFYWHMLGNKFLSFLVNVLYNTTLSDMETCYKLIETKLFKSLNIQEKRFGVEPEITCKLLNQESLFLRLQSHITGAPLKRVKKCPGLMASEPCMSSLKTDLFPKV